MSTEPQANDVATDELTVGDYVVGSGAVYEVVAVSDKEYKLDIAEETVEGLTDSAREHNTGWVPVDKIWSWGTPVDGDAVDDAPARDGMTVTWHNGGEGRTEVCGTVRIDDDAVQFECDGLFAPEEFGGRLCLKVNLALGYGTVTDD
jgi:hypothetical protein